ncbi:MAG: hypothetical protein QM687_04885 [Ferruginibacter sp.]
MKYKHILSIFILGFILQVLGAMLKITHAPGADNWLKVSAGIIILSAILLIIKLLKSKEGILNK